MVSGILLLSSTFFVYPETTDEYLARVRGKVEGRLSVAQEQPDTVDQTASTKQRYPEFTAILQSTMTVENLTKEINNSSDNPSQAAGLYTLRAQVYKKQKQYQNALDDINKAVELIGGNEDLSTRMERGQCYLGLK